MTYLVDYGFHMCVTETYKTEADPLVKRGTLRGNADIIKQNPAE